MCFFCLFLEETTDHVVVVIRRRGSGGLLLATGGGGSTLGGFSGGSSGATTDGDVLGEFFDLLGGVELTEGLSEGGRDVDAGGLADLLEGSGVTTVEDEGSVDASGLSGSHVDEGFLGFF